MTVYFDNSATTRVLPEVADFAKDIMLNEYGNPSSLHHKGFMAEKLLTTAREKIAKTLSCRADEIFFSSCGTEANNLAVLGVAEAYKRQGNRVIISAIEHSSVIAVGKELMNRGFEVIFVAPNEQGEITAENVAQYVNPATVLVSVMCINSETGVINDVVKIANKCKIRNPKVLMHSDCVQAYGKYSLAPLLKNIDLITASGHKIYAPKGSAFLYKRKGVRVRPLYFGSMQEGGLHSGTENVPAFAAMGMAAEIIYNNLYENQQKLQELYNYFMDKVKYIDGIYINSPENGAFHIINISIVGIRSEIILHYLEKYDIYISTGSACSKGKKSHVLTAMGLSDRRIDSAIRISFSPYNTTQEIDFFFEKLTEAMQSIKKAK